MTCGKEGTGAFHSRHQYHSRGGRWATQFRKTPDGRLQDQCHRCGMWRDIGKATPILSPVLSPNLFKLCEYCNKLIEPGEEHVAPEDSDDFDLSETYNGICIVRRKAE